jgi:hypothetical protein
MEINPIDIYLSSAVKIYGADRVYKFEQSLYPKQGAVAVHFPEVTITNDEGGSHLIKDLFIKVRFNEDGAARGSLYGVRATMSTMEVHHGYLHSHIETGEIGQWGQFCLGDEEVAIAAGNAAYNSQLGANRDKMITHFEYLLHYLPIFAAWESISGVPHIHMSTLVAPSDESNPLVYNYRDFITKCLRNLEHLNVKIKYSKIYPFASPIYNREFECFMGRMTSKRENVTPTGVYIGNSKVDTLASLASSNVRTLILGSKRITCKIIHNDEEQEQEQTQVTQRVPKAYRRLLETILSERLSAEIVRTHQNAATVAKRKSNTFDIGNSIFKNIVSLSNVPAG